MEFFKEFFKNLLFWNRLSNFEIISHDCSLFDPFKTGTRNFDPSKNMAAVGGGGRGAVWAFFTVWTSEKFFKFFLSETACQILK